MCGCVCVCPCLCVSVSVCVRVCVCPCDIHKSRTISNVNFNIYLVYNFLSTRCNHNTHFLLLDILCIPYIHTSVSASTTNSSLLSVFQMKIRFSLSKFCFQFSIFLLFFWHFPTSRPTDQ